MEPTENNEQRDELIAEVDKKVANLNALATAMIEGFKRAPIMENAAANSLLEKYAIQNTRIRAVEEQVIAITGVVIETYTMVKDFIEKHGGEQR